MMAAPLPRARVLDVGPLPAQPLAAAAHFHTHTLPLIAEALAQADVLTLILPPADHTHRAWRAAALAALARDAAPVRVNALAGEGDLAPALAFVEAAAGLTGQVLPLGDGVVA